MNQDTFEEVKKVMARVNIDIVVISVLKWTKMGCMNLIQMTILSTTVGKNPLEEME